VVPTLSPNPIAEVDPQSYHWFTGDGMVHGVRLREGMAQWYRNRWIRTPSVARQLGEPPPRPAPIQTGLELLGANTNVLHHAGRTLALVEGGITNYELTDDLGTAGPCHFDGAIRGGYTAHPKHDPDTGELHAVSYSFGRGNRVQYSVLGVDGAARRTVDIKVSGSPMMHDFSLTRAHLADGKVRETRLDDHPQEFPRIDDRLAGHQHRYGYAMATSATGVMSAIRY
jgi:carotenoid cleavage oxygenase